MAAITSAGSGDWNSTTPNAPWPSGTVPVSGDTVTIADGHTVTIPAGYTAVCGTSPADDTGTPALQCSSGGTGVLVVNGTLQWQGPVRQADATWTVNGGGRLLYDASGAADPDAALYTWAIADAPSQANAVLVLNGSSGSHVTVDSVSNHRSGGFGLTGTGWAKGGRLEATFADISYMGPSGSSGTFLTSRAGDNVSVFFDDCTLDNCGRIYLTELTDLGTFRLLRTKITNPSNTSYTVLLDSMEVMAGGQRLVSNCDIAGRCYFLAAGAMDSGFTFTHNIHRIADPLASAAQNPLVVTSGGTLTEWDQILLAFITHTTSDDPSCIAPAGTKTDTYLYRQVAPNYSNAHPVYGNAKGADFVADGWVIDYTGVDNNGDIFEPDDDSSVARVFSVTRSLFLSNAAGTTAGAFLNDTSGVTKTNTKIYFDHNTCNIGCAGGTNVFGVGAEAGGTNWPPGTVPSVRSNIAFREASGTGLLLNSNASATVQNDAVTAADYNALHNLTGSIYGAPSGQFASTPGANDITADPQFVDPTRRLLNFDQGYLGEPVATAWATSTGYSVGDVRSNSDAAFFGGETFNFRCVAAHTSGAATEPGVGNDWSGYWEPAALKTISDDVLAGNTYSGGTNSLIGELVAWVKAGFAPRNATLKDAGHDGVTIGAVEGSFGNRRRRLLLAGRN